MLEKTTNHTPEPVPLTDQTDASTAAFSGKDTRHVSESAQQLEDMASFLETAVKMGIPPKEATFLWPLMKIERHLSKIEKHLATRARQGAR